jgi:hypothetical protein
VQRDDVEADLLALAFLIELCEPAERPEAGVVAQARDELIRRAHRLDERAAPRGVGEVRRHGERVDPVLAAQLGRELLDALDAPRDEHQVVPERGELAGELGADARRRARDEYDLAGGGRREGHRGTEPNRGAAGAARIASNSGVRAHRTTP